MAAGTLPEPGTKYGPCEELCSHRDCMATRTIAASHCPYCDEIIGYERRFYRHEMEAEGERYAHATCVEDALS